MTRHLLFWVAVGAIGSYLLLAPVKLLPTAEGRNTADWVRVKEQYLEKRDARPLVLLAGGSATAFGLRAAEVSGVTGNPVFNFGLHAGLGQSFLLELAFHNTRSGDAIVWSPEYETLTENYHAGLEYGVRKLLGREDPDWFGPIRAILYEPLQMEERISFAQPLPSSVYHPSGFSELGDQTRNAGNLHPDLCVVGEGDRLDRETVRTVGRMAEARGVLLLFRFPSIPDEPCNRWLTVRASEMENLLRAEGIPILNAWEESLTEPEAFHDTKYHLNARGAADASHALAEILLDRLSPGADGYHLNR